MIRKSVYGIWCSLYSGRSLSLRWKKRIWQPGYGRKQSLQRGFSVCPDRLTLSRTNIDFSLSNKAKALCWSTPSQTGAISIKQKF